MATAGRFERLAGHGSFVSKMPISFSALARPRVARIGRQFNLIDALCVLRSPPWDSGDKASLKTVGQNATGAGARRAIYGQRPGAQANLAFRVAGAQRTGSPLGSTAFLYPLPRCAIQRLYRASLHAQNRRYSCPCTAKTSQLTYDAFAKFCRQNRFKTHLAKSRSRRGSDHSPRPIAGTKAIELTAAAFCHNGHSRASPSS